MERPTRRSATAANGLSAASNGTASSSSSSSRRRRREADPRDSGAASDGGDTDSSAVAVEMGARTSKASASKKSARAAKGKSAADGHDADHAAGHRASGRGHEDHREDADSEDPAHDDDAHANASAMVKLSQGDDAGDDERAPPDEEDAAEPAPPVVVYATRARRERSQSVVSTASDSASSIASTRHGAEEEEDEEEEDGAAPRAELHGEKLAELEKKKKMVEEGTLAEYCRRVAEFKEERNRLLQSAEWHKNLQLKNTADLHGFEVQRAHNIWLDSKEKLKSEMLARADALLAKLRGELATLQETKRLPTHVVAPKKSFVLPPRKAPASAPAPATTAATAPAEADAKDASTTEETDGVTTAEATPRHSLDGESKAEHDGAEADEDEDEAGTEPAAAPQSKRRKTLEGSAPVPSNVLRLPLDDISSDLASIMGARETASAKIHTALPAARLELRVDRRRLLCGKYVFEEGDEVVVTAAVLKEDYIGVISSVSEEEVYVKLSTGQKVRVAVDHIAFRRCEIRPFLRGSAGIESLQTSGWVECEPF